MRAREFIVEVACSGQNGGAAGAVGGSMVGGPTTYEQEHKLTKHHGHSQRRTLAMTSESLNSSYSYEELSDTPDKATYSFDTDNGDNYKVALKGRTMPEIVFARSVAGGYSMGITNTGDAARIFATVIQIVKDYVNKHHPVGFSFDAKESSRKSYMT